MVTKPRPVEEATKADVRAQIRKAPLADNCHVGRIETSFVIDRETLLADLRERRLTPKHYVNVNFTENEYAAALNFVNEQATIKQFELLVVDVSCGWGYNIREKGAEGMGLFLSEGTDW